MLNHIHFKLFIVLLFSFIQNSYSNNSLIQQDTTGLILPNGWRISPIGNQIVLGDLPIQLVTHPSNHWIVSINAGQSDQSLIVIDTRNGKRTDSVKIDKTFYGSVFSHDGRLLYVSGGNNNSIEVFKFKNGRLKHRESIHIAKPWPYKVSPTGMCIATNQKIYVSTKEDSSIYEVDLVSRVSKKWAQLMSEGYATCFDIKSNRIWVSEWGNQSVACFDLSGRLIVRIPVGSNPNEIVIDIKTERLFVACSNDNSVYVIDINSFNVQEILNTSLYLGSPTGSTPNGLCIDTTRGLLFIANADNNNIAIFSIGEVGDSKILGYFPTAWYPTQVKLINGNIYISNAKGLKSASNPFGPNPIARKNQVEYQKGIKNLPVQYIGSLFRGTLQVYPLDKLLSNMDAQTKRVYSNTPFTINQLTKDTLIPKGNPIPQKIGDISPIKHVFYIIKENRTYDQVLSDIEGGDGDTNLLLFGKNITPNQHKLASEFVLLDHFYVDAEVSADGHNWSTAAIANDFTEKTWPTSYGGRGGDYVYEGQSKVATPQKGFIWNHAKNRGLSYRTYGEFADDYKANIEVLENHLCSKFTSWDEHVRDTTRFNQWKTDFDSLLSINMVPQLNTLRFINDHTEGVRKGRPTPFAHVADNDLAVGLFVEYLSNSSIWDKSVVFILEDDAQNGADHIDAHRSTAYIAGSFVKRNFIDHTHYSTSSMLRTIELILGMSPMSQYDASAKSMWRCFSDTVNMNPFKSVPNLVDLNEINSQTNSKSTSYLMEMSEYLDLSKEDVANEKLMNDLLWKYVKGESLMTPVPERRGFIK